MAPIMRVRILNRRVNWIGVMALLVRTSRFESGGHGALRRVAVTRCVELEAADDRAQHLRLRLQALGGGGALFDERGVLLRHVVELA